MPRPRVLMLCDRPRWAYDFTAQGLLPFLSDLFNVDVRYIVEEPKIDESDYDLIYVFFWGARYHRRFISDFRRVVKEVSSHRWEFEHGCRTAEDAFRRYMLDAHAIVTTSERLHAAFSEIGRPAFHYPLGVNCDLFHPEASRDGPVVLGWAGNIADPLKNVHSVLFPACANEFDLRIADGAMAIAGMANFYRSIDVICVTSTTEGTPLPLIEAMACGSFPVACDVGVVPEVIEHGKNGLIVDGTPEAFREAFKWCRENLNEVRRAGRANSELIRSTRTWRHSAERFSAALHQILDTLPPLKPTAPRQTRTSTRAEAAKPCSAEYSFRREEYFVELDPLLPDDHEATILVINVGSQHLVRHLVENGYQRVVVVDPCEEKIGEIRATLGDRLEWFAAEPTADFLRTWSQRFRMIILNEPSSQTSGELEETLRHVSAAIPAGGKFLVWMPKSRRLPDPECRNGSIDHRLGLPGFVEAAQRAGFANLRLHQRQWRSPARRLMCRVKQRVRQCKFALQGKTVRLPFEEHWLVEAVRDQSISPPGE